MGDTDVARLIISSSIIFCTNNALATGLGAESPNPLGPVGFWGDVVDEGADWGGDCIVGAVDVVAAGLAVEVDADAVDVDAVAGGGMVAGRGTVAGRGGVAVGGLVVGVPEGAATGELVDVAADDCCA